MKITTSNAVTGTDSTARLLAMFGGSLSIADGLEPGRIAGFKNLARDYGLFIKRDDEFWAQTDKDHYKGTPAQAVELYRGVTDDERLAIDSLMERFPSKRTYCALMEAALNDATEQTTHSLEFILKFYPSISEIAGTAGEENAFAALLALPDDALTLEGEELEKYTFLVGVAARFAYGAEFVNLHKYIDFYGQIDKGRSAEERLSNPDMHIGEGAVGFLYPEYASFIADNRDSFPTIFKAMSNSSRVLEVSTLRKIASGEQPLPLVEGLL